MPAHGSMFPVTVSVVYSSNESDANLFTKCGSPTIPVQVTCTINSGVRLTGSSTSIPGLLVPAFPGGSTISIVNNGSIYGKGGRGGNGGDAGPQSGAAGLVGGTALKLLNSITITNASGEIFAGGKGGDGGDSDSVFGGGGGGGGQGTASSNGGSGGTGLSPGASGSVGNISGPGNGGNKGGGTAQNGADGRAWGLGSPQAHAVDLNGFTCTFVSGNDAAHVKGAVS